MENSLSNFKLAVITSSMIVIPFMVLEWVNRRGFNEGFPFLLFGILWLLPIVFMLILMPVVQDLRTGKKLMANLIGIVIKVILLVFIAWMWLGITLDQMPCFLGVPNCD